MYSLRSSELFRRGSVLLAACGLAAGLAAQSLVWEQRLDGVNGFGSPGVADLNADGVADLVVGLGREEVSTEYGAVALDGTDGSLLWSVPARSQVYTRPLFADITGDGTPEVFIAGRDAQLWCIDGRTGSIRWAFDRTAPAPGTGWFNFYLPQWIADQDGDGHPDLLICNGGDATAPPTQHDRPAGYLLAISSATGRVLQHGIAPDGKEMYATPLLLAGETPDDPTIVVGTGGETVGGTLYRLSLREFILTGLQSAQEIVSNPRKGYIAPCAAADLTGDGIADLIVPELHEHLRVFDGATFEPLWQYRAFDHENYVAPALGHFNADGVPDVAALLAFGSWPMYFGNQLVLLDGATGEVLQRFQLPSFQVSSPNVLDLDGDGRDEVLLLRNDEVPHLTTRFVRYAADGTQTDWGEPAVGMSFFSTPIVSDLAGEGVSLVLSVIEERRTIDAVADGVVIRAHRMPATVTTPQAWPAYLGRGDGYLSASLISSSSK